METLVTLMKQLNLEDATKEAIRNQTLPGKHALTPASNYYEHVSITGSSTVVVGDIFVSLNGMWIPQRREFRNLIGSTLCPSPLSLLESSPNFRPETYTHISQEATLFNYSGDEVARTKNSQSFLFNMLYRSDSQAIVHIALSLKVSARSKFWGLILPDSQSRLSSSSMPVALLVKIMDWLRGKKTDTRSLHLTGILREDLELDIPLKSRDRALYVRSMFYSRLLAFSNDVKHWQCPWSREECLWRRPMYTYHRSYRSQVYLRERQMWVRETRFCPGDVAFESQTYTLRVLHCMQLNRCAGLPRFLGVVRDIKDCVVAYLDEFPAKGKLVSIMQQGNRAGRPVDRRRREKWCRQLLHTVAAIHRQTFVVGMFGTRMDGMIAIDADDNVILLALCRPMLITSHRYPGTIPPEHRDAIHLVKMTPQIDMFQLGLVLWQIAGNKPGDVGAGFCDSFGCETGSSMLCSETHADPIALKMDPDEYDEGLARIIDICRAEDPSDRKPAAELIDLFPGPVYCHHESYGTNLSDNNFEFQDYQRMYGACTGCENCAKICTDHNFHCFSCNNNDFDICKLCFDRGLHCYNDEHFLYESRAGANRTQRFSNVKENGQREVFEL